MEKGIIKETICNIIDLIALLIVPIFSVIFLIGVVKILVGWFLAELFATSWEITLSGFEIVRYSFFFCYIPFLYLLLRRERLLRGGKCKIEKS